MALRSAFAAVTSLLVVACSAEAPRDAFSPADVGACKVPRTILAGPSRFEAAKGMPKLHAVVITADTTTGAATSIERISLTRAALEDM